MADQLRLPPLRHVLRDANAVVAEAAQSLTPEDWGLFGPGSVTWRLRSQLTHLVAGLRALLIQALHPVAMAAVDQHSNYRNDPWGRANRTTRYVLTTTFSSTPLAHAAAASVRRVHAAVEGVDPVTGRKYRADDADLLLWVHCAGVSSELVTWDSFHRPLSPEDADRFVQEQIRSAALVGLASSDVPASARALADYMASAPTLPTDAARRFARSLVTVRMPVTVRPFWFQHLAATVATLPEDLRAEYRFPRWIPAGRLARLGLRGQFLVTHAVLGLLPGIRRTRRRLSASPALSATEV